MKHGLKLDKQEFDVGLSRSAQGYRLHYAHADAEESADGMHEFQLRPAEDGNWVLQDADGVCHIAIAVDGDTVHLHLDGETYALQFEHALSRLAEINEDSAADAIRASMPGSLVSLAVASGESVKTGQTLLIMESMKMETTVVAPRDGIVADVHYAPGDTFEKDAVLLKLEPEAQ